MKKLRLICPLPPRDEVGGWSDRIFNIIPLQLTTIGTFTPPDWEVEIQDENVEELTVDASPDVVGITIKACTSQRAYALAREYRALGIPVILGGPHASLAPQMAAPHADAVVRGGVEENWHNILDDAVNNRLQPVYTDTGTGPMPHYNLRWDLLGKDRYRVYSVVASRGCTMRCKFCTIPPMYNGGVRRRPIEDVVEDIARMPYKHFLLWDEYPTSDPHYAEVFFRAITPLRCKWFGETTTLVADNPKLLEALGKSGCIGLFLGVESVSRESLLTVKKGFNRPGNYAEIVKRLNDHGILAHAGVVLGFDHDDEGTFDRTLEYLYRCGFSSASIKILTPYPGTPLYDHMQAEGRIIDDNMDHYDEHHVVFQPTCMSAARLQEGFEYTVKQFYSLRSIGSRIARNMAAIGLRDPRLLMANFGWRRDYARNLRALHRSTTRGTYAPSY